MDDLVIAVDLKTGAYYSLNRTASAIWELIMAGKSGEAVQAQLTQTFHVAEETARSDVARCLEEWCKEGLILQN